MENLQPLVARTTPTSRRHFLSGAAAALFAGNLTTPDALAQDATPIAANEPAAPPVTIDQAAFDATFSHHTTMVNDVRLHYVIGGQGDPLVLLHGWPQTWFEWREIMPALAERFTVVVPDLRGLGDSSRPLTGYDAGTVASDIYGLVEQLGYSEILLVGHDIGAWVAYAYATANREQVFRLVVLEAPPPDDSLLDFTILNPQVTLWHPSFHSVRDLPEALVAGKERLYLSWFYRNGAYNPVAVNESVIDEYVRCYASEGGMRAGFEYYRAYFTTVKQTKEVSQEPLEMPVLVLGGATSFGEYLGQLWSPFCADLTADVIPQAGHWIPEEQPELLRERLLAFLG